VVEVSGISLTRDEPEETVMDEDDDEPLHWGWYVAGGVLGLLVIAYGTLWLAEWKNINDRVVPEASRLHEESISRFRPVTVGEDIIYKNYNKCMHDSLANAGQLLDESVYRADAAAGAAKRFHEARSASCLNKTVEATANVSGSARADLLEAAQKLVKTLHEES
jgi:hypothetical protein